MGKKVAVATPPQIFAIALESLAVAESLTLEVDLVEEVFVDSGLDIEDGERRQFGMLLQSFDDFRGDCLERGRHRMRRVHGDQRHRTIAALAQLARDRQLAEKRDLEGFGEARAAAVRKDLVPFVALAANVIAHVLDHAEDRNVHLGEHLNAAADVDQCDFLWRGDDDAAVEFHSLRDRQLRVAGAGRQVEDEAVELAPFDVEQEFGLQLGHHRTAPDHGLLVGDEKRHRDIADTVPFQRYDFAARV